jgi:hypothetical protein
MYRGKASRCHAERRKTKREGEEREVVIVVVLADGV